MQTQPGVGELAVPTIGTSPSIKASRPSLLLWLLPSPFPSCFLPGPPLSSLTASPFLPVRSLPVPPSPPLSCPSSLLPASFSGSRSPGKPGADLRPEHDLRMRRSCAGWVGGLEVPGCSVPLPSRPRLLLGAAELCKCPAGVPRWGSGPEGLAEGLALFALARVPCLLRSPACRVHCLFRSPCEPRSPAQPGTACYLVASHLAPRLHLWCGVRT